MARDNGIYRYYKNLSHLTNFVMNVPETSLPEQVDVAIIGGGVAGISAAWFLNQAGISVAVLEKGRIAGEQSSRNWGWIRQQGRDAAELPIMMESMRLWESISAELDEDIGFRREGCLYLCENESEMARHYEFLKLAAEHGLDTQAINRPQLVKLIPECPERWQSAVYTPGDARAEPSLAVPAMAKKLADNGVPVLEQCAVTRIEQQGGKVYAVKTEHGRIRAGQVLVAAGAWSTFMLNRLGINLPQLTVKATVCRTEEAPLLYNGNASGSQIAFKRRLDGGYTIAASGRLEVMPSAKHLQHLFDFLPLLNKSRSKIKFRFPEFQFGRDPLSHRILDPKPAESTKRLIRELIDDRLPMLRQTRIVEYWSGLIDALPDVVPVMDQASNLPGLWIATGFSGHGFGIGPAAGKIMAELIQGNRVEHELNRFRLSRFSDGSKLVLGPAI